MERMELTLTGTYNSAVVFTDEVEENALRQIELLLEQPFLKGERIRVMPDVHAGKGSTIGTSLTIFNQKVVPNLVGVDIGCGIRVFEVRGVNPKELAKLDQQIKLLIPSGFSVHPLPITEPFHLLDQLTFSVDNPDRIHLSQGTLGGGNHFIELGTNQKGQYFLQIHSGSRNLGHQIARYHQKLAQDYQQILEEVAREQGKTFTPVPKDLAYLEGQLLEDYLTDMKIAQVFAVNNRLLMGERLIKQMGWQVVDTFDSMHNYIDIKCQLLRKGATDASKGTRLVIPLNMRDGSLICTGLGNPHWNYSAPHGAGRIMSRTEARNKLSLADFKETMAAVYSTSISKRTLDEAPFAYKKASMIQEAIGETVEITDHITPIYNFKAT